MKTIRYTITTAFQVEDPVKLETNLEKLIHLCYLLQHRDQYHCSDLGHPGVFIFGIWTICHEEDKPDEIQERYYSPFGTLYETISPNFYMVEVPRVVELYGIEDPFVFLYYALAANKFHAYSGMPEIVMAE